jgi:hypothetical protein
MSHYLNMHTVRVTTVVTLGLVLGMLLVGNLYTGFRFAQHAVLISAEDYGRQVILR